MQLLQLNCSNHQIILKWAMGDTRRATSIAVVRAHWAKESLVSYRAVHVARALDSYVHTSTVRLEGQIIWV